MKPNQLIPVILCGGSGTRLWPLSRESYPKQFLALEGDGWSMLQKTARRLGRLGPEVPRAPAPMVVCNAEHRFIAAQQLAEAGVGQARLLLEPTGRNTAPALTLAALQAAQDAGNADDPVLLVMPADHVVTDEPSFVQVVETAWRVARGDALVTFGIVADRPETGYGYIRRGAARDDGALAVDSFAEKPSAELARDYIDSGEYLWNSGLFVVRAGAWLQAIERYRPDILQACRAAMDTAVTDLDFVRPGADAFRACPAESIDYAVMERLPGDADVPLRACVVPLQAGWSDLGTWDALWQVLPRDSTGNAAVGETISVQSQNSLLLSSGRLVAGVGLDHVIVIETPDAVLVADMRQTQAVKQVVSALKLRGKTLADMHRKVVRPWGWYDAIDSGDRFQVKRIVVNPGASLSLQMHHHRAEHWIVVKGTAEVTKGDEVLLLSENESTYIPLGHVHRLANPGKLPLEIIEVQSGSYLGEDDIVRYEDTYGRLPEQPTTSKA
ncbi:MAG: mannose-1-phosphate guanylyltransferase/mannose-6-phosphate isomerase [Burkholderiales bacterium]|nr:mannose-1-phosphate guanylyltransferase/mannose-6-phosphate isomerase [Burkholderiales bacterium]MBK8665211.1 mannose-1-phosphate guanylyltransferase/mannose-6-phosphate isomerase [Burkholderiales bacterium]